MRLLRVSRHLHTPRFATARFPAAMILTTLVGLGACTTEPACLAEPAWGLRLEVRDSLSGLPAASNSAATADRGDGVWTLEPDPNRPELELYGVSQAGVYTVVVNRPAYAECHRSDVSVRRAGPCTLEVTRIVVRLQPVAP